MALSIILVKILHKSISLILILLGMVRLAVKAILFSLIDLFVLINNDNIYKFILTENSNFITPKCTA